MTPVSGPISTHKAGHSLAGHLAHNLMHAKGAAPHYILPSRAEIGLYSTLHRLKARVATSAIVRRLLIASRDATCSTAERYGSCARRR
jgi:hypothetical protein